MALLWTLSLCGFLSLALSTSPECQELVKPMELPDPSVLYGRWLFLAAVGEGTMNTYLENLTSSWFELSAASEEGKVNVLWGDRVNGKCLLGDLDYAVSGNKHSVIFNGVLHEGEYLNGCPGCLIYLDNSRENNISSRYLFLSKREADLKESDLETLKKQAECLNLPQTVFKYEATDLCPQKASTQQ